MTNTTVFEKHNGGKGVVPNTCWDMGCTYPLQVIKELDAEIMPRTQELVIIEVSRSKQHLIARQAITRYALTKTVQRT